MASFDVDNADEMINEYMRMPDNEREIELEKLMTQICVLTACMGVDRIDVSTKGTIRTSFKFERTSEVELQFDLDEDAYEPLECDLTEVESDDGRNGN